MSARETSRAWLGVLLSASAWGAEPEPRPDNAAIASGFALQWDHGDARAAAPGPVAAGFDLSDYERQIAALPTRPKTFATEKLPAKIPPDFAPMWIRGQ